MHQDIHDKDDEAGSLAGVSASSPARRSGQTVIPFPQRPRPTSNLSVSAAGVEAASTPASFQPLGSAVAAVVMRLRSKRPSIKAIVQGHGEVDAPDDL